MSAYWTQPISDQVRAANKGAVSAESLVRGVREAIERREPELAAWAALSGSVLGDAREQDRAAVTLPLRGISLGVKDLVDVAGLPTRAGSTVTPDRPVDTDAACVSRFRELGALVQGKTVTTEFGYFSPGPTRNPHAPDHTPGGSSSGSAAAVGAGTVPVALGTQTAGSLTRPAAYCGAAGMVLAQGTSSLAGVTGLSDSLDSLGLLTRTVADLHYVYSAFTGRVPAPWDTPLASDVLVWGGSELGELDPTMRHLLDSLPEVFREARLCSELLDWDDHVQTLAADHLTVMSYEAARSLRSTFGRSGAALSAPLRALVEQGRSTPEDARTSALVRRDRSRELLAEILDEDRIIVGPAALGPAPHGLGATGSPALSRPWQLLGVPVVVVPGARTSTGLPLGLQLIGRPGYESSLFDVATKLEPILRRMPAQPA